MAGENAESAMLINSLREVIRSQATQIEELQTKLKDTETAASKVKELEERIRDTESKKEAEASCL